MGLVSVGPSASRPSPGNCIRRGGGGGRVVVAAAPPSDPEPGAAVSRLVGRGGKAGRKDATGWRNPPQQWPQPGQQPAGSAGSDSTGGAGRWRWQGRPARPLQRGSSATDPEAEQQQPQDQQQQQEGVWASQPRKPLASLAGPPLSRRSEGGSANASTSADKDEGLQQQRRQWRQHTLRSLRQDLHQQQRRQRQGQTGAGVGGDSAAVTSNRPSAPGSAGRALASYSSDLESDSEYDWPPPVPRSGGSSGGKAGSAAGPQQQRQQAQRGAGVGGQLTPPQRQRWPKSGNARIDYEDSMLPEGYFLRLLQAQGVVGEDGQPTEQGRREGVGLSSYLNVGINKMLSHSTDVGTIFSLVRDVGYLMDTINTSTAMHRLGKVARRRKDVEPGISKRVVSHPCYALLLECVESMVEEYQPRGLANTMWGLAALGDVERADLARRLALAIVSHRPGEYRAQELSNVIWALGTLGVLCEEALDTLLKGVVQHIDSFIPQGLSNMVWACAHLRNGTRGCIGPTMGGNPPTFVPRELRPGWQPSPAFLEAVAAAATRLMPEFQSQTLSNLLWGYCKLDVYPQQLFEAAANELVDRFRTPELARQFRAQELSNSLYAFAQGSIINEQLLGAFERELSTTWVELDSSGRERRISRLDDFTSQALANTLWSFAYLRWYPAHLLDPITRAVGRKVHTMSCQEISNSIWSFAKFAYHPGPVMAQYQAEVVRRVHEFDGQSLTTTMWAMAALSATHSEAFVKLVEQFVKLERTATFQDVQYNQVLQAVLLAQFEQQRRPGEFRADIDLPDDIVDTALQAWQAQQQAAKLSSFQLEVSEALGQLGIEHELEHLTAVNLLSVDIAIVKGGKKVAIEVDGPFHFAVNTNSPLGQTMIRRRLLRAVGWTVISVPYHTWYKLPLDQRPVYMSRLLVRKDASFHDQIMKVSEDLLSTEFKKGLGSEAGVDALQEEGEEEGAAAAGGSPGRTRFAPRNLGRLLEREGLMLTKSAARRLVDMGYVEQVDQVPSSEDEGEGQEAAPVYHARRSAQGGSDNVPDGPPGTREGEEAEEADAAASAGGSMTLDAIVEAAARGNTRRRSGRAFPSGLQPTAPQRAAAAAATAAARGRGDEGAERDAGRQAAGQGQAQQPRPLLVDEVDSENPLRPRYTDFSGNVLEGVEPFSLHGAPQYAPRSRTTSSTPPPAATDAAQQSRATSSARRTDGGDRRPPLRRNPMARQQQQALGGKWLHQPEELPVPPGSLQRHTQAAQRPPAGQPSAAGLQPPVQPTPRQPVPRLLRAAPPQLSGKQGPMPWQQPPAAGEGATPPTLAPPLAEGGTSAKSLAVAGSSVRRRQQGGLGKSAVAPVQPSAGQPGAGTSHVLHLARKLSLADLRRLCESKGLPTYGTKAQLAGRLVAQQKAEAAAQQQQ